MAKKEKKGKYLGKRNEELENLYSELNSVDKDTKKGRREFYNVSRKIRKAKEKRILSGLKGLLSRKYPVPAGASGAASTMGFIMPEMPELQPNLQAAEPQAAEPQIPIEEITVGARTRRLPEPNIQLAELPTRKTTGTVDGRYKVPFGIFTGELAEQFGNEPEIQQSMMSKLGRNQLKSLERRKIKVAQYPDAYPADYATPEGMFKYKAEGGQMNIQQQTQNVANQGRYGDSMLMHVNPAEVRGLSQVMPLTVNPETGQPEAFLPFLAPLLGSWLGGSLLTGLGGAGVLGAGLSSLGASALGSGLAQWAATGDLKKGLLAGVTGYGIGSALQGASGAADAANAAKDIGAAVPAGAALPPVPASITAGAVPGATTGTDALKNIFSGTTQEGLGHLATAATDPLTLATTMGGMAPTAMMESEEAYARQMQQMADEEEESRRQNFLNTPEPILYSAGGGPTNMDPSVQADIAALSMMAGGGRTGYDEGGPFSNPMNNLDYNNFSGDQQRFTPARQTYQINPEFMAGFAPETMYFQPNTLNQPATATTTGGAPILEDTYQGSKGGYGGMQASIAPTVAIDPYQAYSGQAPTGLQFTQAPPPPAPVAPPPDIPTNIPTDIPGVPNIPGFPDIDWSMIGDNPLGIDWDNLADLGIPDFKLPPGYNYDNDIDGPGMPPIDSDLPSMDFDLPSSTLPDFSNIDPDTFNLPDGFDPSQFKPPMPQDYGMNNTPGGEMPPMDFDPSIAIENPTMPQVNFDTPLGIDGPPVNQYEENQGFPLPPQFDLPNITKPMPQDYGMNNTPTPRPPMQYIDEGPPPLFDPNVGQPPPVMPPSIMQPPIGLTPVMPPPAMIPEPIQPVPQPSVLPPPQPTRVDVMQPPPMQPPVAPPVMQPPMMPPSIMQPEVIQPPAMPPSIMPPPMQTPIMDIPTRIDQEFEIAPPMVQPPVMQPPVAPPMMQPPMMQPPMQLPMSPEMSMSMEEQLQLMYPENLQQAKLANTRKSSGRRGGRATGGDTDTVKIKNKDELMGYMEFMSRKGNNENALKYGMLAPIKDYKDYRDYKKAAKKKNKKAVGGVTDNNEAMLMEIVQKDPLATEVVMFIQGESDNEQALAQFVEKYGNELFLQLREAVLQNLAPGAQTEGLVEGVGNGGMDDDLNGTIGNQEKIAVSQDEFIVPADVVSMLGDGSSDAGSEELYAMMDRVRQTKTGTTEQAPKLANAGGLLPR